MTEQNIKSRLFRDTYLGLHLVKMINDPKAIWSGRLRWPLMLTFSNAVFATPLSGFQPTQRPLAVGLRRTTGHFVFHIDTQIHSNKMSC